ncbi:hypothetical protein CEP52_005915 [Fusarium oligoseptatum]|uniref:Uncharacterized protein n=1 Tax=Fusarium oligoseptatum TaxID=2604345 RepID=A0A428TVH2_9HYPO|nr:hypothetical protein CEP52_005915 [Fusarium oligoseptatum]
MPEFVSTPLFGGAIVVDLPSNFADVSKLRQVPDNQEVWIDQDGFTSIIFDITERVGSSGSGPEVDGRAMTTHLEDMVGSDINTIKIWNTAETEFSRLEEGTPAYTLISTQTPHVNQSRDTTSAPDFTAIILTLLRLEKQKDGHPHHHQRAPHQGRVRRGRGRPGARPTGQAHRRRRRVLGSYLVDVQD